MELEFGKNLERDGSWWLEKWYLGWEMEARCFFGRISGCGSMALYDAFLNLFVVAAHTDVVLKEMWSPDEGGECWNPLFFLDPSINRNWRK